MECWYTRPSAHSVWLCLLLNALWAGPLKQGAEVEGAGTWLSKSVYTLLRGNPQSTIQLAAPGCLSISSKKLICRKIARGKSSQGNYFSHHPALWMAHTLPLSSSVHESVHEACKSEFLCQLNCIFSVCQAFNWWFSVFLRSQRDPCHWDHKLYFNDCRF